MTGRLGFSLRVRWAIWVAALTSTAGILALIITVSFTAQLLHRNAPRLAPADQRAPTQEAQPRPGEPIPQAGPLTGKALADETLAEIRVRGGIAVGLLVLVAIGVAWAVAGRMLRPVAQVTDTARQISGAGDGRRIAYTGPRDELHTLAETFDAMLDRVDANFDEQKAFVANVSHELRTPLALMRSEIDVALDGGDIGEQQQALAELRGVVDRMNQLVERLLHLSRAGTMMRVEPHDLSDSVAKALQASVRLEHVTPAPIVSLMAAPVRGDAVLLDQLATNLVENAFAYRSEHGQVWVRTGTNEQSSYLEVENDGLPIDPAHVDELFDRFQRRHARRRTAGGGYGLGLTIVSTIAHTHGGDVVATARATGGLRVVVSIPRPA